MSTTFGAAPARAASHSTAADVYIRLLGGSLVGYAVLGKGFAYVGAPPVFIGEVLFALGAVALLCSGNMLRTLTALPNVILAVLATWVILRTAPFIGIHGIDALRDSVVVIYGVFGVTICALLLQSPERLNDLFRMYGRFAAFYGPGGGLLYYLSKIIRDVTPVWPSSGIPLMMIRPGEVAVHVAGAAVFSMLFFRRVPLFWNIMLLVSITMVSAQSRGGMLAILLPLCLAAIFSGHVKRLLRLAMVGVIVLMVGYATRVEIQLPPDFRAISVEQLVMNALSITGGSTEGDLDGTKMWRLRWWEAIENYTLHGPLFWTGQGFGVNLAESDGFVVGLEHGGPILRSPHNANMTILARAGVPGLVLWITLLGSWFLMLLVNGWRAARLDEGRWRDSFVFLACYVMAILINASFDVALEGPMLGIWFWVLFGTGVGASMIFRASLAIRQ
jgi:hypothetical protein